jgi:low temperature requirement protein LtrA
MAGRKSESRTMAKSKQSLLRERDGDEEVKVGSIELFFDLVFVFAVTQLSHFLLHHFTPLGALQAVLLLMAVWWVWIYTSWVTNWLDPDKTQVRVMLFVLMLGALVLSTSIPEAFAERGLTFAVAYASMQVGRSLFALSAFKRAGREAGAENFLRITLWLSVSALFWILGGLAEGHARLGLWAIALAIEYAGPAAGFFVPGLGRSETSDWAIEGGHLAERCGLFVIIALGESILVTGDTFSELDWNWVTAAAFLTALAGSIAMWWIYFNIGAERGSKQIERSEDPGRIGRLAYTYLHLFLIGGIILTAVGDEIMLSHPEGHPEIRTAIPVVGGPALYVAGNLLFKYAIGGRWQLSHLIGLGLFAGVALLSGEASPLALGALATAVLIVVAGWETWATSRK